MLGYAAVSLSLLLCLASITLWVMGNQGDQARTWRSGLRSYQVASWDGTLQFVRAGDWLNDASAARGTTLLARRAGFAYQPGVEGITRGLVTRRDTKVMDDAAAGIKPAVNIRSSAVDTLTAWNSILLNSSNALVSEQEPRVYQFAGVSIARRTVRLPHMNDAGAINYDPAVPTVTVSAPCWIPATLFGALPGGLLLAAAAPETNAAPPAATTSAPAPTSAPNAAQPRRPRPQYPRLNHSKQNPNFSLDSSPRPPR
jgi:hypothetical protein